jgi:hypothetical protein
MGIPNKQRLVSYKIDIQALLMFLRSYFETAGSHHPLALFVSNQYLSFFIQ